MEYKKIILADDHQLFREGLRSIIELDSSLQIVSEVDSTDELLKNVHIHQPDLILQDYRMPNGDAISTLNEIKSQFPQTRLIILTGVQSGSLYKQLFKSKVDGIILKEVSGEYLLNAIHLVLRGKRILSPTIKDCLSFENDEITFREFQVLELIIIGLSSNEIANKLNLSVKTVENHRYNLMQKLEVSNIVELIKLVREKGILEN